MSPDLDPAIEAAEQALLAQGWRPEVVSAFARDVVAAAAPLIRAQERAAVRAELLALEQAYRLEAKDHFGLEAYDLSRYAVVIRDAADNHVAPEHVTPREKP